MVKFKDVQLEYDGLNLCFSGTYGARINIDSITHEGYEVSKADAYSIKTNTNVLIELINKLEETIK